MTCIIYVRSEDKGYDIVELPCDSKIIDISKQVKKDKGDTLILFQNELLDEELTLEESGISNEVILDIKYIWFKPNNAELREAVIDWLDDKNETRMKYGHISTWDTSKITDMGHLFAEAFRFNDDISLWNTSNVSNMSCMFFEATNFNQDISNWDTSKVENMNSMFKSVKTFDQDLSKWNISKIKNMNSMFRWASSLNRKPNWNLSKVIYKDNIFDYTP